MEAERELIGYADPWSLAPGDVLSVLVSTTASEYEASVVRLRHGDNRKEAPGLKETIVAALPTTRHAGRRQDASPGSFGWVPHPVPLTGITGLTVAVWVWPTTCDAGRPQGILSCLTPDGTRGWALLVNEQGHAAACVGGPAGPRSVSSGRGMQDRHWYLLCATFDLQRGAVSIYQLPTPRSTRDYWDATGHGTIQGGSLDPGPGGLAMAALTVRPDDRRGARAGGLFNGKLDSPRILLGARSEAWARSLLEDQDAAPADLLAVWDLASKPHSSQVEDRGPHRLHAVLVNLPTRAVTSHGWTGRYTDFRLRPTEYAAVHFHDDDLADAGWEADLTLTLPSDLRSGVYAVRLRGEGLEDRVPFFVRPRRGMPTADVALLLPTFTYLAYGNSRVQFESDFATSGVVPNPQGPDPRDLWLRSRRDLGSSLYDHHSDGSGWCYASRKRPLAGLRPDYLNWMTGAPRHLGADLYIIDWLEHLGVPYDVLCDEHVHVEGRQLLEPYKVVITGTHPEYCSEAILDALTDYTTEGGNLIYMGGNGFYSCASLRQGDATDVIEVRRGASGTRPWTSEPGEGNHSFTGEPGGLWEHRGRPSTHLVGVRFAGQGWTRHGRGFSLNPAASDEPVRWVTAGIDRASPLGSHGLCLGSAAGDEIDRYDIETGSPPHATVLASFQPPEGSFVTPTERSADGASPANGCQADVVLLETAGQGRVVALSSMTWAASLSTRNYDNDVARMSFNILAALADCGPHDVKTSPNRHDE